jgi:hypothetical protein
MVRYHHRPVVVCVDKVAGSDGHAMHLDGDSVFDYVNPTVGRSKGPSESSETFGPHICISDGSVGNGTYRPQAFMDVAVDLSPMGPKANRIVYVFDDCHRWSRWLCDMFEVADPHS